MANEYFNGSEVKLTGKIVQEAGAEFEEFVWLEGPKKGKKGIRGTKATMEANALRVRTERESMQAGFRRLRVNAGTLK